jgi:glycosyltransferase involved in cell wall biosynthesis
MRYNISACITAGNEERNIRRCLESVKWADEIIVVDSYSSDRTPDICREYTDRVYQHEWLGYIGQKNLIKDMAAGPWILFLDADEEVSPELRSEIEHEFESASCVHYAGYAFPRMVWFLGRWIRHGDWYPDIKLRLFRKDLGVCGGKEPHDRTTVNGPVKQLQGNLFHYTYDDILDQLATMNRFSSITAETKYDEGKRFRATDLLFRPFYRFLRGYLIRRGFLDGLPGLIIAITTAYGVFIKYGKLWELQQQKLEAASKGQSSG